MAMFLDGFYSESGGMVCISAEQASRFAKNVAGDFNPIHDPEARRFCVPGDLLFALVLSKFGIFQRMSFAFRNMVGDQTPLMLEGNGSGTICVKDATGKIYLEAAHEGASIRDEAIIETFARRYVAFSGLNFPHFLKPLMEKEGVMFNTERPLVVYDSMDYALTGPDFSEPDIQFAGGTMEVAGKRAEVKLNFTLMSAGTPIGTGAKKLIVSGLRPYEAEVMDNVIEQFYARKAAYEAAAS